MRRSRLGVLASERGISSGAKRCRIACSVDGHAGASSCMENAVYVQSTGLHAAMPSERSCRSRGFSKPTLAAVLALGLYLIFIRPHPPHLSHSKVVSAQARVTVSSPRGLAFLEDSRNAPLRSTHTHRLTRTLSTPKRCSTCNKMVYFTGIRCKQCG